MTSDYTWKVPASNGDYHIDSEFELLLDYIISVSTGYKDEFTIRTKNDIYRCLYKTKKEAEQTRTELIEKWHRFLKVKYEG